MGKNAMTTPATAAGRALMDTISLNHAFRAQWQKDILAIEAEARQQERERIRAALLAVSDLRGSAYRRVLAILDAPEAQP